MAEAVPLYVDNRSTLTELSVMVRGSQNAMSPLENAGSEEVNVVFQSH